jgi:long-chain fatty acid transport protein
MSQRPFHRRICLRSPVVAALLAIGLGFPLLPGAARAGNGFSFLSQGAKSAGRGGAGVALGEDALSVAANPAALLELQGARVDGTVVISIERKATRKVGAADTEEDSSTYALPVVGFSFDPFAEEGPAFGAGSDFRVGFSLQQPIEYVLSPTVTGAARVHETLAVGLSFLALFTYVDLDGGGSSSGGGGGGDLEFTPGGVVRLHRQPDGRPIDPPQEFDAGTGVPLTWAEVYKALGAGQSGGSGPSVDFEIKSLLGLGIAGQAGVLFTPHPLVSIGVSARSPGIIFEPRGKGVIDFTRVIKAARESPETSEILDLAFGTFLPDGGARGFKAEYDVSTESLIVPGQASIGIAGWPHPRWLVTAEARMIWWKASSFDTIKIKATNGSNRDFNELNGGDSFELRYRLEWENQLVLAAGTSVGVTPWLTLRAGYNYGKNPVPEKRLAVNRSLIEHHATAGASFYLGCLDLDLAYVYGFQAQGTLRSSGTRFIVEQHVVYVGIGYAF